MNTYSMDQIRNVALIAPHGVGKTSLADAMLHLTGKVGRRGNVDDGSSVFDYQDDEIERKQTISASMAWFEHDGKKINLIDTPGVDDFRGDVYATLPVVEGGLFLIKADGGLEVASESLWRLLREQNLPTFIVLNRMNKEHANFEEAMAGIEDRIDGTTVPVQLPIGQGESFRGIVDLIGMKAHVREGDKSVVEDIPGDMSAVVEEARERLLNAAAETDDELVEKFLEEGSLSDVEIITGLASGIAAGTVFPIFLTAADSEVGVEPLLQAITDLLPSPAARAELDGINPDSDEAKTLAISADGAKVLFAFKRQYEVQGGDITWLRVFSGSVKSGDTLTNSGSNTTERIGQMSVATGKGRDKVERATAGDIVVAAKLKATAASSTLYESGEPFALPSIAFPAPTCAEAISPNTAGDEDKMGTGLTRLHDEDPTFVVRHESELHQTLLIGQGEMHIAYILDKLKKLFGVEVGRQRPRVAFKETIKGKAEAQGRYKKQTGGRGQFGDVHLRVEPQPRGEGFEFVNAIVGGVVPGKFIPAVEKGVRETLRQGVIAGYEMVDIKVTLFFGSFHQVDSSENSFKVAARLGLQKSVPDAKPAILEPIMLVCIRVPQDYMGDVMGDISTRRGQIQGSDSDGPYQIVNAHIPEDELYQYSTMLRSMSQGTGSFTMKFSHYAEVPGDVQKRLIEEHKKSRIEGND
ncbi:MAG: elongation factor G [bacterium]